MTQSAIRLCLSTVAVLCACACAAVAPAPPRTVDIAPLYDAIDSQDLDRLAAASNDATLPTAERRLASAVVQAALGLDSDASANLEWLIGSDAMPAIRARAMLTLSGLRVRQSRYGDAASLMSQIEAMDDAGGVSISPQTRDFLAALSTLTPMEVSIPGTVELPLVRDAVNLPRVRFSVAGVSDEAVLDTGAAFSTVNATTARRLQLRFLGADAEVTGSTGATVQSGLAFADEIQLGEASFRNVPFIVVPDDALNFPQANYQISSIIGFPLISRMGRVEFTRTNAGTLVRLTASPRTLVPSANLVFSGWQPVVLLNAGEANRRLRFFLDTGARSTTLYDLALRDVSFGPTDAGALTTHGAGGRSDQQTQVVRNARLRIGDATVEMDQLNVLPDDGSSRHGVLGQDVLSRYDNVVLDFGSMTMTLQ